MAKKVETVPMEFYDGAIKIDFYPNSHRYKIVEEDGEAMKEWIPSPSSILNMLDKSGQLVHWAVNCFEEKMLELAGENPESVFSKDDLVSMITEGKQAHTVKKDAAASVGSIVHAYAEQFSKEGKADLNAEDMEALEPADHQKVINGVASFHQWIEEAKPEFLKSEFSVMSRKQRFVGTSDELANVYGGKYLLDYKTSKGVYTSHFYQASAYLKAYEEEHGEKLDGAIIAHIVKDDYTRKDGSVITAGSMGIATLSRADLVTGYQVFKALHTVYRLDKEVNKKIYASQTIQYSQS